MANVILAYGPGGSGKTQAAREWRNAAGGRFILDEFDFSTAFTKQIEAFLNEGIDVWVNVIAGSDFEASLEIPGHTVWPRKFESPVRAAATLESALSA